MVSATAVTPSTLRLASTRREPAAAKPKATASPMPREAPVTTTTLPARSGKLGRDALMGGTISQGATHAARSRGIPEMEGLGPAEIRAPPGRLAVSREPARAVPDPRAALALTWAVVAPMRAAAALPWATVALVGAM